MTQNSPSAGADIIVLGIFAADLVFRAPRLPIMGETLLGQGFGIGAGGKGSNQAIAAARAGGKVAFITRIGQDTFGELALSNWRADGIIEDAVTIDPAAATGAAFIFVSTETGNNAIIVTPGAAAQISPADIAAAEPLIAGGKVFMTQLEQPVDAAVEGLKTARKHGLVTIFNPAPAIPVPDEIWAYSDWATPNETEAGVLSGVPVASVEDALKAARALQAKGVKSLLITLGEKGALLVDAGKALLFPPLPGVTVVDTTGAGDAFNAGFAVALAEGRPPEEAVRFATAVAGLSVGKPGTAASMPTRAEVVAALPRTLPPTVIG
jgi:ribokinase